MGLFDIFGSKPASRRLSQKEVNDWQDNIKGKKDSEESKVKDLGTSKGDTKQVPSDNKGAKKSIMGGASTTFTTQVIPTDFVPNPNKLASSQTPDFYRFGQHQVKTSVVNGETITRRQWHPIPELIADRLNPTLANIRLIRPSKKAMPDDPQSPGQRLIPEFSKFFLTSVQEAHQEKVQTVETFNDWYAFFYGEKPPVYNFSGYLLNLMNYNWLNEFMYYYQNFWRGTKAVELGAKVYLTYNYQQIQGYPLNVHTSLDAVSDKGAPFSITMLVTNRKIFVGTPDDGVIRDSLLPGKGLIDTNASATPFAKQLVERYLKSETPAKKGDAINDNNLDKAQKTIDESSQSEVKQDLARVGEDQLKAGESKGSSWASSVKNGASGAFSTAKNFLWG